MGDYPCIDVMATYLQWYTIILPLYMYNYSGNDISHPSNIIQNMFDNLWEYSIYYGGNPLVLQWYIILVVELGAYNGQSEVLVIPMIMG